MEFASFAFFVFGDSERKISVKCIGKLFDLLKPTPKFDLRSHWGIGYCRLRRNWSAGPDRGYISHSSFQINVYLCD